MKRGRRTRSLVHQPEDLLQGVVVPPLRLSHIEHLRHPGAASVSTGRRPGTAFEPLDGPQDEVCVRHRRAGPEHFHDKGRGTQLGEPRREIGDLGR
jgi:hypothetical protein